MSSYLLTLYVLSVIYKYKNLSNDQIDILERD